MNDEVYVIGAGGHAKVVISSLQAQGVSVGGIFDDDASKWGGRVLGALVLGGVDAALEYKNAGRFILAIGDNVRRAELAKLLAELSWATVVHPAAYVDSSVRLGLGTVVFAGAVVQPETKIGRHCIINTGATVDHDCEIGDYAHLAPGSHLAGGVIVGSRAMLGIGVTVLPGMRIGEQAVVGAGSVVTNDVDANKTVVGVPARPLRE